ncbi:hypothetical protein JX265_008090 [Neoarthrinium moseri]|uniref:Mannan endo-1,6-alpha-mannosidase n=1 Tax=Neoarthrinium moseri TaxID=1658444 RepID=A0A9Q0AP14_9PEZI|nr:hypothetical protein JX265_008090 [Neoarthrinium moseri]
MVRPSCVVAAASIFSAAAGLDLSVNDEASVKQAAAQIAKGLYFYHNPSSTAGDFNQPQPWFWWLSGNGWNGLLDYMVYTNDTTYQSDLLSALSENVGPKYDFVPTAQFNWEANDDQAYWVYNALTAMEYDFPSLACEASPDGGCLNSWQAIGTNAFNLFVSRWNSDSFTCNGGLKWQYRKDANGYTYKNSVTNGGFFQVAARLARYTGNQTFADWATKIWDWSTAVGLVSADFHVYDGTGDDHNCTEINHDEWSYNIGTYLHGAANMYAATEGDTKTTWESRVQGLVKTAKSTFFGPSTDAQNIMYEQKCEKSSSCTTDQTSFKSSLSRWMGKTTVLVPSVSDSIMELLHASAKGAAASCSGYENSTCGQKWTTGSFDGQSDFGVELSALEVVQSLLVKSAPALEVAHPA